MAATKTLLERQNDFIKRLKDLYPDYKLISEYVNGDTLVKLEHKEGYIWETKPRYLDGVRQCKEISLKNKKKKTSKGSKAMTHEQYEERFKLKWGNDYTIISTYKNLKTKLTFKHNKCGKEFEASPDNMLNHNKKGCPHCYGKNKRTIESTNVELSDNGLSDYTCIDIYSKDGHTYGTMIHNCDLCDNYMFDMRLSDIFSSHAQRCPKCSLLYKESNACREITEYLDDLDLFYVKEKKFESCKNINILSFDFHIVNTKLLIEYDGIQHYKNTFKLSEEDFEKVQLRDKIKTEWCKDNGYKLLRIKYNENHILKLEKFLKKNKLV